MPFATPRQWDFFPGFETLPAVFDASECQRIIDLHKGREPINSQIEGRVGSYRDSDVYWLKPGTDDVGRVFQRMNEVVMTFNRKTFQFELEGCMDLQLTLYTKGQHYNWHADLGQNYNSRRKLSVSVLLSEPGTYQGGDLQFFESDTNMPAPTIGQGDAVAFPSWYKHRIPEVTEGDRWSLVGWWTGPPFR